MNYYDIIYDKGHFFRKLSEHVQTHTYQTDCITWTIKLPVINNILLSQQSIISAVAWIQPSCLTVFLTR